jgi:hypothetical protein
MRCLFGAMVLAAGSPRSELGRATVCGDEKIDPRKRPQREPCLKNPVLRIGDGGFRGALEGRCEAHDSVGELFVLV